MQCVPAIPSLWQVFRILVQSFFQFLPTWTIWTIWTIWKQLPELDTFRAVQPSQAASLVHLIIPWDSDFSHQIRMIPTSAEISCSKGAAGQCCWQSSWRSKGFYPSSSAYPSGNSLRVTVPSALYQSLYSCSEGSAHFQFQSFQLKKILHWLCARRTDGY